MKYLFLALFTTLFSFSQSSNYPPESGTYETYTTKKGQTISVGDHIELGLPYAGTHFIFISQDNTYVRSRLAGDVVEITKLEAATNNKKSYKMQAYFKGYGVLPVIIDIENALKTEEIILLNQ